MLVASLDATAGSVITKAERISPASSGFEPLLLVRVAAVTLDRLHVAGVGRGTVEHFGRPWNAPHRFGKRRVFEIGQPSTV